MSDDWNDDENDQGETPGGLRKLYEKALADKKTAEQRAAKAENALAVTTVSTSLKEKGYKDTAAKWASLAGVDVTDSKALDTWLAADGAEFKLPDSEHDPDDQSDSDTAPPEGAVEVSNAVTNLRTAASAPSTVALERAIKALPDDADKKAVYAQLAGAGV